MRVSVRGSAAASAAAPTSPIGLPLRYSSRTQACCIPGSARKQPRASPRSTASRPAFKTSHRGRRLCRHVNVMSMCRGLDYCQITHHKAVVVSLSLIDLPCMIFWPTLRYFMTYMLPRAGSRLLPVLVAHNGTTMTPSPASRQWNMRQRGRRRWFKWLCLCCFIWSVGLTYIC